LRHARAAAASLLAAVSLPAAAGAQAAAAPAPETTFYATATVRERPLSSATAAVTVLGREEIEASGARSVAELLRLAPGVDVTLNGHGGLATAQIRGGDPNFTLVLLDGVPLNDPTYQVGDVFDLQGLPALAVERIEIVRGPLSSFYGSTGLAGVIHVITRRGEAGAAAFELAAGAGDASRREVQAAASGGGPSGTTWFVGAGFDEEERRVAAEALRRANLHANLATTAAGSRLELRTRWASWRSDDYPDASGGPRFGTGDLRRSEHREASLGATLARGGGADGAGRRHELALALYRHQLERDSPAIVPAVPAALEDAAYTLARLRWTATLVDAGGVHLATSADVQAERGENASLLLLPPELGGPARGDYAITRTLPGAAAELTVARGDGVLEIGSRLDAPEDRAAQWSPRLGVGWRPGGGALRVHASAGRAWKQPSFFALASPRQLGGNPDLRPETVLGGDLGIERRSSGGTLQGDLTLFYNRYAELIDFDFATFRHVNRSRVEARGAEAALDWRPAERLSLRAAATWQEVEDLTTRARLRHRPKWSGSLRLAWRPADRLDLRLETQGAARSFDVQIPVPERETVAGYAVLALAGTWEPAERWQVTARIDNLADRRYETLIGFPAPGRALRAGLRYRVRRGAGASEGAPE
jgi:iron complex outermembrane receptor protein/vitamin B12 transporter